MSANVNSIHIIGNLGSDPEVRYTGSGKPVCNVSVATKFREDTTWHRVVLWDKQAKYAEEFLHKGDPVYIMGRMSYRKFTAKDGQERESAEIVAYECQGLGSRDRPATGRTGPPKDHVDGNVAKDDGFDSTPF